MKRRTSEPLTANHASKLLFQELPDEVLEQISGGDGTCASCTVDYIAVNDKQQGVESTESSDSANQSSIAMNIIGY